MLEIITAMKHYCCFQHGVIWCDCWTPVHLQQWLVQFVGPGDLLAAPRHHGGEPRRFCAVSAESKPTFAARKNRGEAATKDGGGVLSSDEFRCEMGNPRGIGITVNH